MKIYRDAYEKLNTRTVVALGCFDGVHIAHARVINEAVDIAGKCGAQAAVWCFAEPPKNAFLHAPVPLITGTEEKISLIKELGADILVMPDFTPRIAAVGAREFVTDILCSCAGAVHLVTGRNYSFGRGGEGNSAMLGELCRELGIGYTVVDDVSVDGIGVSSSEIRRAVSEGRLEYAARLLGRDFSLVFEKKNGRYTARPKHLVPPDGEYRVRLCFDGEMRNAAVHIYRSGRECLLKLEEDTAHSRLRVEFCCDRIE